MDTKVRVVKIFGRNRAHFIAHSSFTYKIYPLKNLYFF